MRIGIARPTKLLRMDVELAEVLEERAKKEKKPITRITSDLARKLKRRPESDWTIF